jgi:glucose-6-phosphate 1-dehydrogenase
LAGVFYVRGKRMQENNPLLSYSSSRYRIPPFLLKGMMPNRLIINIQPAMDIRLLVYIKPGLHFSLKPAEIVLIIFRHPITIETLVLDALLESHLCVRSG